METGSQVIIDEASHSLSSRISGDRERERESERRKEVGERDPKVKGGIKLYEEEEDEGLDMRGWKAKP